MINVLECERSAVLSCAEGSCGEAAHERFYDGWRVRKVAADLWVPLTGERDFLYFFFMGFFGILFCFQSTVLSGVKRHA